MQWRDSHVSITLELCGMKEIWREVLTQRHKAESDRWFRTSCFSFQMHIHANISHTYFIHASISHIYITHANISHTYITYTWRITHTYISHKHGGLLTRAWWRVTYRRLTHTYHIHGACEGPSTDNNIPIVAWMESHPPPANFPHSSTSPNLVQMSRMASVWKGCISGRLEPIITLVGWSPSSKWRKVNIRSWERFCNNGSCSDEDHHSYFAQRTVYHNMQLFSFCCKELDLFPGQPPSNWGVLCPVST